MYCRFFFYYFSAEKYKNVNLKTDFLDARTGLFAIIVDEHFDKLQFYQK